MKNIITLLLLFWSISALGQIETTTSKDCYIVYDFDGKEFLRNKKIKKGERIVVLKEYENINTFYEIRYKNIIGCLKEGCIFVNHGIDSLFNIKKERIEADKNEKAKRDSIRMEEARKIVLEMEKERKERCGRWYDYIQAKIVVIGMPAVFVTEALGKPEAINETEYSFGIYRQYVYPNMYVYTKNGKVDSIQTTTNYK